MRRLTRKKIFLIVQSVLCALIAGLLAAAALRLYFSGPGEPEAGEMFGHLYTREKAGAALLPVLPLFAVSLGMTVIGIILGIRDENADKPVREAGLLRDQGEIRRCAVHQTAARGTLYLRAAIIALAVAMIVLGILNGGLDDVFAKGAAICTECIGLG